MKENKLFLVDEKNKICSYDLKTFKRETIMVFECMENKLRPNSIVSIRGNTIILTAYNIAYNEKIMPPFSIYKINLGEMQNKILPISIKTGPTISTDGNKIYYSEPDDSICFYSDTSSGKLKFKGKYPTISPDGIKLAYVLTGTFFESIYVVELLTGTSHKIISFFGPNTVDPTIRWSNDSHFIAVHERSDISPQPLYVFETENYKIVCKLEKVKAYDWFVTSAPIR